VLGHRCCCRDRFSIAVIARMVRASKTIALRESPFQEHPNGETETLDHLCLTSDSTYLLVPERHHWIDFGRAPRGNETSHQRDDSEQHR